MTNGGCTCKGDCQFPSIVCVRYAYVVVHDQTLPYHHIKLQSQMEDPLHYGKLDHAAKGTTLPGAVPTPAVCSTLLFCNGHVHMLV